MSYLAIGAVTKAMAELLSKKLNKPPLMGSTTFRVTTLPPDDDRVTDDNGVNLFLYKVGESPFNKNMDWRGDRATPVRCSKPPLTLTLSYMITAYAKKASGSAQDDITTQQLLGNAMAILHENPVLNDIHDSDFDADLDTQFATELRDSFDKIKMSFLPISIEEFSKIWTGFSKAYRLSVAYEVSLVEIGPTTPAVLPAPSVQTASLKLSPTPVPIISEITPGAGPAGAQVVLNGSNFKQASFPTTVTIGDIQLDESDLSFLSSQQIRLTIPEAPSRGPLLSLVVTSGTYSSAPVTYTVKPWIDSIVPLRGITGIGLTIPFAVPVGASLSAEIDGTATPATADAASTSVQTTIPLAISSNGPKTVVLIVNGARTNARLFEVLPLITGVSIVTQPTPAQTTITVTGERLNGQDISVSVGDLLVKAAANANPTQIIAQVNRVLATNLPVSVMVDGRASNVIPARLDSIDPAQAAPGDEITLTGAGLSGRVVSVSFGASSVNVGAQPFATRMKVSVPGALPAGAVSVTVTVDSRDTNPLPLQVTA